MTSLPRRLVFATAALAGTLAGALLVPKVIGPAGSSTDPAAGIAVTSDQQAEQGHGAVDVEGTTASTSPATSAPATTVTTAVATETSTTAPVSTVTSSTAPPPTSPPPLPHPFEPAPNESQLDAKRSGAAVAYTLTNYGADWSSTELAAAVTLDPQRARALGDLLGEVHQPGMWSRGTIEYAQLGGYTGSAISIMVVVRQDLGSPGSHEVQRSEKRTMDVRLVKNALGEWQFERLASAGGHPVARPADLSPLAASVVDDERIDLPDSARWDIYSGHTDEALLRFMADLAELSPYKVVVLHTGHPHNVFGTDRLSNHTVGRAVDIYEIDSVRVIDAHDRSSWIYLLSDHLVMRSDIREYGSPWLFDGAVASNFTNEVHHDHIHVGVNPGPESSDG